MAMFRDVSSEDDLRALSKDLMKNDDPKVAIAANKIQLQLALAEYRSQTATADQVLELAKGLLSKTEIPDRSTFVALAQAASMLGADEPGAPKPEGSEKTEGGENGLGKKVDELVDALEAKFRDVPDPNIGMMAWRLKVQRLPNFESYLQVLDTSQAMRAEPEALTAAAKGLMEKIPSPWTALALSECATQFEYSGKVDVAKNLFELASTQLEKTKISGLKQQLQQMSEGFNKRSGAIGKPLPMEKLVDTKGAPLDLTKYEGKVILVDFWATWCGPCVQEIPNIKKVYEEKHAEGFEVIAINLDDDRSDLDKFLSENEMPWSVFVSSDPEKVGMKSQLEIGRAHV